MSTKTITRNADGSVSIRVDNGRNADGSPALAAWDIQAHQIDAHRTDPAFDAALDAPTLARLDRDRADRIAAASRKP